MIYTSCIHIVSLERAYISTYIRQGAWLKVFAKPPAFEDECILASVSRKNNAKDF